MIEPNRPIKRCRTVLALTDEDLEHHLGIDPRNVTDDQFRAIAKALEEYYNEFLEEAGYGFGNVLNEVVVDPNGSFDRYFQEATPIDQPWELANPAPQEPICWKNEVWLDPPNIFYLETYDVQSDDNKGKTGYLGIHLIDGAYVFHNQIQHDVKFDTFDGQNALLVWNEAEQEDPKEKLS
ncbi:MAG: hypothetical protein ABEI54_02215 [Candidatus Bipolaricaulia bacterium]